MLSQIFAASVTMERGAEKRFLATLLMQVAMHDKPKATMADSPTLIASQNPNPLKDFQTLSVSQSNAFNFFSPQSAHLFHAPLGSS